jgi:galactose mutarotase-like enzyme
MPARRHLELDARGIPTGAGDARTRIRFALGARGFDDGYDGLTDGATFAVSGGGRRIAVTHAAGFPVGQVYSPPGAQFICFEPMTAPANALISGTGLRRAVPGRPYTAAFEIAVSEWPGPAGS